LLCRALGSAPFPVSSRPLLIPTTLDATVEMKQSSGRTIFSTVFRIGELFAIDGTQFHIGSNPGRPDDQKSLTERHQIAD
jgi:hypothetical protein